jgi:hypothetical protein
VKRILPHKYLCEAGQYGVEIVFTKPVANRSGNAGADLAFQNAVKKFAVDKMNECFLNFI